MTANLKRDRYVFCFKLKCDQMPKIDTVAIKFARRTGDSPRVLRDTALKLGSENDARHKSLSSFFVEATVLLEHFHASNSGRAWAAGS